MEIAILYVAVLVSSSLYLVGVFIAGLVTGVPLAWKGALITLGLSYLTFLLQTLEVAPHERETFRKLVAVLVMITIVLGAVSGLALLVFA